MTSRRFAARHSWLGLFCFLVPAGVHGQTPAVPDSATLIGDLVITASRQPEPLSQLAASATVIRRDVLVARQAWTVDRALQAVPGVSTVGDATFGQEVRLSMRGLTSGYGTQRTLIMLDGRPLTDEYLGHVDIAQYPLLAMDRIEVVRGPSSAAYGSSALGGVINMLPRRGGLEPRTEILLQGGSFGTVGPSVMHSRASGPFDVAANASFLKTNGYLENSQGQDMDWERQNGLLNLGYTGAKVALRGYTFYTHGNGTDQDFDRKVTRISQDVSLTVSPDAAGRFTSRAQLYYTHLTEHLGWFDRPVSEYRHHAIGAILTQQVRLTDRNELLAGTDLRRNVARADDASGSVDQAADTWALFVQDRMGVGSRVTVLAGVRGDHPSGGALTWSGRGGINVQVGPSTTAFAAAGRAFRAPTLSDRFLPTTSAFGLIFEGNPELKPETVQSVELGIRHSVGQRAEIAVTGFSSRAKGFWDFLPQEDGVFRPTNIAEVSIQGIEVGTNLRLTPSLDVEAAYALTDATYHKFTGNDGAVGNRLDDNVKHQISGAIGWHTPSGHSLRAELRHNGDRATDPNDPAGSRLDPWTVVDISGAIRVSPLVEVSATLRNALDEDYRTRPEFRQAGRSIYGGVRLIW